MNISQKIEEIRQQPEHIRMRWVWGSVAISMFIILAVWVFSAISLFSKSGPEQKGSPAGAGIATLKDQLQEINKQTPSISDSIAPIGTAAEGVTTEKQGSTEFNYPATDDSTQTPQSDQYKDLSNTQVAQ